MIELEEAVSKILSSITPSLPRTVPLGEAVHRYCADELCATSPVPPFDNSAMDGYAVRAEDAASASVDHPIRLHCIGSVAAGESPSISVARGQCIRVYTGSPLPPGADAVVMQEEVERHDEDPDGCLLRESVRPWENVRFRGEDVRVGVSIAPPGTCLEPHVIGVLAATGIQQLRIHPPPRIALLAGGSELREAGSPLPSGCIFESNRLALSAACKAMGVEATVHPLFPDRPEAVKDSLSAAFEQADMVVTTGGVSVGDWDLMRPVFESMGGRTEFWKVAIRPGKPFVHGRLREKHWFGLPGNPVSAWVTFQLLVRPALLAAQGANRTQPSVRWGILGSRIHNAGDRRHFIRVSLSSDGTIQEAGLQASHCLSSLAKSDGLLNVGPKQTLQPGEWVPVISYT